MSIVSNLEALQAGVLDAVAETWRQTLPVFEEQQRLMLYSVPYTNLRKAPYVWKQSVPFPVKWLFHKGRTWQSFDDVKVDVTLMPFELTVPWNFYDAQDDQIGDLRTHVNMSVKRFFQIPDKLIAEYLNGAAVLNDSLVNSYDGAAIFSTVDGDGANRLGVAGGNIVTGSGLTVDGVINDVAAAQRRFLDMLDPAGEVIFKEEDVDYGNLIVVGPNEANEVFQRASKSEYIKIDAANLVSESNYQKGTWQYRLNPYLTDASDYFVVVQHDYWRPFLFRAPSDVRSIIAEFSNSDRARDTNQEAWHGDVRMGISPWQIASIVKINN